ncbi:glucokinase [Dokdonella sp.]|uniref:glucokinase n=1 Tax=Dokdonella sp. TaxID=2291710 RepID=UPI002F3EAC8F
MRENRYRIASRVAGQPLIAADVGGTHARIASIVPVTDGRGSAFAIADYCKYACADYPSLASIIEVFRDTRVRAPVPAVALAIAGFVVDDAVVNVNLPWPVSISGLRARLGVDELAVVNDFKAIAYAVGHVDDASALLLGGPAEHRPGPMLVVGPGTGLGGAVHIAREGRPVILATEVGQATLAATTDIEFDVLRELRKRSPRVLIEHVLSGTGLSNLHAAMRALRGVPPHAQTPAQISAAALAGDDALASETVEVFCGWFGSVLGDLALLYGAQGGIYLAGGVLPQMKDLLVRSRFIERFLDKGAMREALARTSIRLVDHAQLGVIGAASWYFDRDDSERGTTSAATAHRTGTKATTD